jgi:hypothetical protein
VHRDDGARVLIVERGELAVACNLGDEPRRLALGDVVLASSQLATTRELPPRSCAIVRRN